MSINNSILRSAGLTDKSIKFLIDENGEFNHPVHQDKHDDTLMLYGELSRFPERCPYCGFPMESNYYHNGTDEVRLSLPSTNGFKQELTLTKQRFQCLNCYGTCTSISPDFIENSKITKPLWEQIFDLAKQDISEKLIAHITRLSTSKVHVIISASASDYVTDTTQQLPNVVCMDEVKYRKGHFGFEILNGNTSEFIEIYPQRDNKSIRQYLSQFSLKNRQKVEIVVMDMNAGYQAPIRELFPNAIIVVDRFHIVQLAMKAVQSERIKIQRELSDKNHNRVYKLLKSNWKFFLKAERNIDTSNTKWFRGVNEYMYPQDALQLVFKDFPNFKTVYDVYQSVLDARFNHTFTPLELLINNYKNNKTEMDTVIKTYKKYIKGIKAAFENNASNGRLEGTNRRIKQIGRTAYGYANSMNYFYRIRIQLHNKFVLKQQFLTFKV